MLERRLMTRLPSFLLLAVTLAACGGHTIAPPPTVTVAASASADANSPAGADTGAPVSLRIYQLASPDAFQAATFFPLFETDAAVLKADLLKRDDMLLAPGQSRTLVLTPPPGVTALGIFAAYRDYPNVTWHTAVPLPSHVDSTLIVTAGRNGITARIAPVR